MAEELYASPLLRWPTSIDNLAAKQAVAERSVHRLADGQVVGIGSGSSAYLTLWAIGRAVTERGLSITVVCASYETEVAARTLGLTVARLGSVTPDWGVDGADEVDPDGRLIKGRGGALFKEKMLWRTTRTMCLAVDATKQVDILGRRFPVPVEVDPDSAEFVAAALTDLGASDVSLRIAGGKDGPVFTESANLLLDAHFPIIPPGTSTEIKRIPGVIETGLFEGYAFEVL